MKFIIKILIVLSTLVFSQDLEKVILPGIDQITGIKVYDENTIVISRNFKAKGLAYSDDGGHTWYNNDAWWQLIDSACFDMETDNNGNLYAGNNSVGGLFYSTNKGKDARRIAWESVGFSYPKDIEIDNGLVIILNADENEPDFRRSMLVSIDDSDTTFSESIYGNLSSTFYDEANYNALVRSVYYTGESIIAASDKGLFINYDLSQNWDKLGDFSGIPCRYIQGNLNGELFLATENEGLFKSTDNGINWENIEGTKDIFNDNNYINEIIFNNNIIYLIAKKGIYFSNLDQINILKFQGIDYEVTEIDAYEDIIYFAPKWGNLKKLKME